MLASKRNKGTGCLLVAVAGKRLDRRRSDDAGAVAQSRDQQCGDIWAVVASEPTDSYPSYFRALARHQGSQQRTTPRIVEIEGQLSDEQWIRVDYRVQECHRFVGGSTRHLRRQANKQIPCPTLVVTLAQVTPAENVDRAAAASALDQHALRWPMPRSRGRQSPRSDWSGAVRPTLSVRRPCSPHPESSRGPSRSTPSGSLGSACHEGGSSRPWRIGAAANAAEADSRMRSHTTSRGWRRTAANRRAIATSTTPSVTLPTSGLPSTSPRWMKTLTCENGAPRSRSLALTMDSRSDRTSLMHSSLRDTRPRIVPIPVRSTGRFARVIGYSG